jgi:hypothetical protein
MDENRVLRAQLDKVSDIRSDLLICSQRLEKVCHTAIFALTDSKLTKATNIDLVAAQKRTNL